MANPIALNIAVERTAPAPDLEIRPRHVKRWLEALQLGVDVSHKAVAKPEQGPSPWGRVVEQSPAPGAAIVPGTRVEILIGKPIDGEQEKG